MSEAAQQLVEKLRRITKPADVALDGEVTEVNETEYTCTVKLANNLDLKPVQLKALKGSSDCVVIIPKVGSDVQIVNVGDPDWLVISCDVVEKVKGKIATSEFVIDKDGFQFKRGSEDLKTLMNDLMDVLIQATYTNGAGTTSPANNVAQMQQIKQRIPNLLT